MDQAFYDQLDQWHEEGSFQKIIDAITGLDEEQREYKLVGLLARALNNVDDYQGAIDQLELVRPQGVDDPLWHFRYGYASFYLDRFADSAKEFGRVVELDETDEDAWIMIAHSDEKLGDREGYARAAGRLKELNPRRWRRIFGNRSNKVPKTAGKLNVLNKPVRLDEQEE